MITLLTLVWLYLENQPPARLANHAWYTFWYVVPTLPMFLAFPWLLQRLGFWWTLGACALITIAYFGAFALVVKRSESLFFNCRNARLHLCETGGSCRKLWDDAETRPATHLRSGS